MKSDNLHLICITASSVDLLEKIIMIWSITRFSNSSSNHLGRKEHYIVY